MKDENRKAVDVVKISKLGDRWIVRPARVYVAPGDDVIFATEGTAVTICIPKAELFEIPEAGATLGKMLTFEIGRGAHGSIKIKNGKVAAELKRETKRIKCPYAVYCRDGDDFAEGASSPVMIIDNPP